MKTVKRTVVVYLDMASVDSADCIPHGCACLVGGDLSYIPTVPDGYLRNRVEIEVYVPVKNETIDLGKAEAVKVE